MSKAGKTVLLTLFTLIGLGAAPQSNAQEKLLTVSFENSKVNTICSPLQSFIFLSVKNCKDKFSKQIDQVLKATEQTPKEEEFTGFSYATEPTYFTPPVETITPTITETISVTPTPYLQEPKDMVPAIGVSLDANLIFDLINSHRVSIGKPAFQKDEALCALATTRAFELHGELFEGKGYLHSGLYNRNLPYFITENAKWGSNEAGTVQWWLNSSVHRRAIQGDYTYSCGACNGSQCSQLFTSYTPKGVSVSPKGGRNFPTMTPIAAAQQ